ncbi:phasin family protein [Bosea sp. BH3]|uniref:phasin family protein n=1 Tax=Bosea sp. BH3 TaxID=2871701 RepID=UPI0021CB627F|nr:hypothetical protein [Bosea sp. BH3]MCU4179593.1 hypothetical protein [Bosea sp. BH3]
MTTLKNVPPYDSSKAESLASPELLDGGVRLFQAQLASAAAVPQAIWEANLSILSEMLTFMSHRMRAQAEFCGHLGHCKEIAEAVDVQRNFAQSVTGDYSQEVEKLSDIARKNLATFSAIGAQCASALGGSGKLAA